MKLRSKFCFLLNKTFLAKRVPAVSYKRDRTALSSTEAHRRLSKQRAARRRSFACTLQSFSRHALIFRHVNELEVVTSCVDTKFYADFKSFKILPKTTLFRQARGGGAFPKPASRRTDRK